MKVLMYTENEGGEWHVVPDTYDQEAESMYEAALASKILRYEFAGKLCRIVPHFMCLSEVTLKRFGYLIKKHEKK